MGKEEFMRRTVLGATVKVVLGSMLVGGFVFQNGRAGIVRRVHAQEGCSLATLQGEYLFTATADAPAYAQDAGFPIRVVGLRIFPGDGTHSDTYTRSNGGVITSILDEEGVYTLDADCTGTMLNGGVRNWRMFVTRDGSEGVAIRTDDGTVSSQTFKRR
jgi:hypothetical protein